MCRNKMLTRRKFKRVIMLNQVQISEIHNLHLQGFSKTEISKILSISFNTVKKYLSGLHSGIYERKKRTYNSQLTPYLTEIERLYKQHRNAVVVKRLFKEQHPDIALSQRQFQRVLKPLKDRFREQTEWKTSRVETPVGDQMQIDTAHIKVKDSNGGITHYVLFVAVLSYSRAIFVKAYANERAFTWFNGIRSAFEFFQGVPQTIVFDNAKALVTKAAPKSQDGFCQLNSNFRSFCNYWKVTPIACRAWNPSSKGKVERAVRYIKENAIAGRIFRDMKQLNLSLFSWCQLQSLTRVMNVDGEKFSPQERLEEERKHLNPLRPKIFKEKENYRKVNAQGKVRIDNREYVVPIKFANQLVVVTESDRFVEIQTLDAQPIQKYPSHELYKHTQTVSILEGRNTFGSMDSIFIADKNRSIAPPNEFVPDLSAYAMLDEEELIIQ